MINELRKNLNDYRIFLILLYGVIFVGLLIKAFISGMNDKDNSTDVFSAAVFAAFTINTYITFYWINKHIDDIEQKHLTEKIDKNE